MLSLALFAACINFKVDVSLVYDSFTGIITATFCLSVVIAVIVYVMAFMQKTGLSPGGNTGTDLTWPELRVSDNSSSSIENNHKLQ